MPGQQRLVVGVGVRLTTLAAVAGAGHDALEHPMVVPRSQVHACVGAGPARQAGPLDEDGTGIARDVEEVVPALHDRPSHGLDVGLRDTAAAWERDGSG